MLAGLMRLDEKLYIEHCDRRVAGAVGWPLPWAVQWPVMPNSQDFFSFNVPGSWSCALKNDEVDQSKSGRQQSEVY